MEVTVRSLIDFLKNQCQSVGVRSGICGGERDNSSAVAIILPAYVISCDHLTLQSQKEPFSMSCGDIGLAQGHLDSNAIFKRN